MIKNIQISLKNLYRNGFQSMLGVFSFAAGFSICLIIGLYLYNESVVDTQTPNHQRIYRLLSSGSLNTMIDYQLDEMLSTKYTAIELCSPVHMEHDWKYDVYIGDKSMFVSGLMPTTNRFFELFSIPVLRSIAKNPFSERNAAVLTESSARLLFGDEDPLGKTFRILETETIVSAVIADFPKESSFHANVLLNSENPEFRLFSISSREHGHYFTTHYVLLRDGYSAEELQQQINDRIEEYPVFRTGTISLQPLKDIYLNVSVADKNKHGNKLLIRILIAIGGIMLLLSVINYFNYVLSNQLKQIKDIGIRKMQGAYNFQIISFYLTDIFIWLTISLMLSILLVGISIPSINLLFPEQLSMHSFLETPFIIGSLLMFLAVFVLSGIPLLFILSKFNVVDALRGEVQFASYKRGKGFLTVFQLLVTIVLITGLIVVRKQVDYARHRDLGFEKKDLLHIKVPYNSFNPETFKKEILKHSGIIGVALSNGVPGGKLPAISMENFDKDFLIMDIDMDFIETMKMTITKGRNFLKNEHKVCMVNESMMNLLEIDDIKGKKISGMQIVGVVKNFNLGSIHQNVRPLLMSYAPGNEDISIRIEKSKTNDCINYIEKEWKRFAGDAPLELEFYETRFDSMYVKEELLAKIALILSIVAIAISCFGLMGQILFVSLSRTKEISIRKINGATVNQIVILLNKNFMKWLLIAFIAAVPVSYYTMNKWLQDFAFKTALQWWIFIASGLVVFVLVLITVSWYSWVAARKNPVETLRHE